MSDKHLFKTPSPDELYDEEVANIDDEDPPEVSEVSSQIAAYQDYIPEYLSGDLTGDFLHDSRHALWKDIFVERC